MEIMRKIKEKAEGLKGLYEKDPVTLAFFGDSVTQGCFELYMTGEESFDAVYDSEEAYCSKLYKILTKLYPSVPFNIIRGGINGCDTVGGLDRIEKNILRFNPDLTVVCFGLNDCGNKEQTPEGFGENLRKIFKKLKANGSEVIYMTPNTMNTKVSCHIKNNYMRSLAEGVMKNQNSGVLKAFLDGAKKVCVEENVPICDCYAIWETFNENGVDVTNMLSNYINHPEREFHWIFAYELLKTMMR